MSEYLKIEAKPTEDPDVMVFYTNLPLAEGKPESYRSTQDMEEGSAVAQALAPIEGIKFLQVKETSLEVTRYTGYPWHPIAADINAAMKEFFL